MISLKTSFATFGVKLSKKAMSKVERQIQRLTDPKHEEFPDLGKWFIDICCGATG